MQEFFWFFLGGAVYLIINKITSFFKKIQFINDVKIHSFGLIGFAFEQLIFATTTKYIILESDPNVDEEKLKLLKNKDEAAFNQWKKNVVVGLRESVPPQYRDALEVENWDDLMNVLDTHYKKVLRNSSRHERTVKDAQKNKT